jgi:hypothetical protein
VSVAPLLTTDRLCQACRARLSVYSPAGKQFCATHEPADALSRAELAEARGVSRLELAPLEARPDPALYCSNGHVRALHERRAGAKRKRFCAECRRERDRERHRRGRVRDRSGKRKRVAA